MNTQKKHGFTLIELLLIIVISAILSYIALTSYLSVRQKQQVIDETTKLNNILNTAQAKAIAAASDASDTPVQWGIYIENATQSYHLVPIIDPNTFNYNSLPAQTQDINLPTNLKFKTPIASPATDSILIAYTKLNGNTEAFKLESSLNHLQLNSSQFPIELTIQSNQWEQTLTITQTGQMQISQVQKI